MNSEGSSPHRRKSVSKESVSKATSELNNLLQIISGTSAEIGNLWEGCEGSEQYLNMLRSSIDRAEAVAAQLAEQAGGANQKVLMHPELASFLKPKTISEMPRAKPTILVVDDEQMALVLIKRLLSEADYQVVTAHSARSDNAVHGRRRDVSSAARDSSRHTSCSVHWIYSTRSTRPVDEGWHRRILRKPLAPDEIVDHIRGVLDSLKYAQIDSCLPDGSSIAS